MNLQIIHGKAKNIIAIRNLTKVLLTLKLNGTLYIGYPIIASADESITVDALLVENSIGLLVVFHFPDAQQIASEDSKALLEDIQDGLSYAVKSNLGRHSNLRKKSELAVSVNVVSYLSDKISKVTVSGYPVIATNMNIQKILQKCKKTDINYIDELNAAIQRITNIKPVKKRKNVKNPTSKGSIIKKIEQEIANLDLYQKQAAIETPDGPQRVRGLAGSGKTVVLALKAAYLHSQNPDWDIAVTFQTHSLYQQFRDLIRRSAFEHSNDEPNWDKLKVLHAWGSINTSGLYSVIADSIGYPVRDFLYGKSKYGYEQAFQGVCDELLLSIGTKKVPPLFDAVLIDEAQDLPGSFFKLVYKFLKPEKRVIWAYDELQNLSENSVMPAEMLFGQNKAGQPAVTLKNTKDEAKQDIILPVCYRNTPWALALAHALGFGIYKQPELVQLFDDDSIWEEIGYEAVEGKLQENAEVKLQRKKSSYPEHFSLLLSPKDSVSCHCCKDIEEEINRISDQILDNLEQDELQHDDILIVLPNPLTAKSIAGKFMQALDIRGIPAHLAGLASSVDEMFLPGSIAISNIYRAKGNEAPMVYIANSDYCAAGRELIKLRNTLFTAITRSRAWVRIYGSGDSMLAIKAEFDAVLSNDFSLKFTFPTKEQRQRLRTINRDLTPFEKSKNKQDEEILRKAVKLLQDKEALNRVNPALIKQFETILEHRT